MLIVSSSVVVVTKKKKLRRKDQNVCVKTGANFMQKFFIGENDLNKNLASDDPFMYKNLSNHSYIWDYYFLNFLFEN